MDTKAIARLSQFGYRFDHGSTHTARTMMLQELTTLLSFVTCPNATQTDYLRAIEDENCLGKRSGRTRRLTYRHLVALYILNPSSIVFRALLFFWQRDAAGQPLLALLCAYTRDSILRASTGYIIALPQDAVVSPFSTEQFIEARYPGRFSKATLGTTARNLNSTWTKTGHLAGHDPKIRSQAMPTPGAVAYALMLAYLTGVRGEALFNSEYVKVLDCTFQQAIELAEDASRRGWLVLKRLGNVIEVIFPNLLTKREME